MREQVYQELDQYLFKKLNTELQEVQVPEHREQEVSKAKIYLSNKDLLD